MQQRVERDGLVGSQDFLPRGRACLAPGMTPAEVPADVGPQRRERALMLGLMRVGRAASWSRWILPALCGVQEPGRDWRLRVGKSCWRQKWGKTPD